MGNSIKYVSQQKGGHKSKCKERWDQNSMTKNRHLEAVYMRGERIFNGSEHSSRYEMLSVYMRFHFGLNS